MPFPQQQRAAALLTNDDLATSIENIRKKSIAAICGKCWSAEWSSL
jgi:hypothetical protein